MNADVARVIAMQSLVELNAFDLAGMYTRTSVNMKSPTKETARVFPTGSTYFNFYWLSAIKEYSSKPTSIDTSFLTGFALRNPFDDLISDIKRGQPNITRKTEPNINYRSSQEIDYKFRYETGRDVTMLDKVDKDTTYIDQHELLSSKIPERELNSKLRPRKRTSSYFESEDESLDQKNQRVSLTLLI